MQAYGIHIETGGLPNERATFIVNKDGRLAYTFIESAPGNGESVDPELVELRNLQ